MDGIYFKIEIDGIPKMEEYTSWEKALEGAHLYFAANDSLKEAVIYRIEKEQVCKTFNKIWK